VNNSKSYLLHIARAKETSCSLELQQASVLWWNAKDHACSHAMHTSVELESIAPKPQTFTKEIDQWL